MTTINNNTIINDDTTVTVGLCASRHPMPVTEFIFPESVNPTDFSTMEKEVDNFLVRNVGLTVCERQALDQRFGDDVPCWTGKRTLIVYVTGLTAATAAVIKVCALNGVNLTLMHYDRDSGEYVPQQIF